MPDRRMGPDGESARTKLVRAAREQMVELFRSERSRESAVLDAFAFLDPTETARRAGVARSAFYHYWGEPPDGSHDGLTPFQRFLGEVLENEWGDPIKPDLMAIAAMHGGTFSELMNDLTHAELSGHDDEMGRAAWRASVALAAYGGSHESNIDAIKEVVAEFYDALLERFDRRVRAPLTTKDIVAAVMACIDGFMLQRLYGEADPTPLVDWSDPESGREGQWSIASISVQAIVMAMTEPA